MVAWILVACLLCSTLAFGQSPVVPSQFTFGDIKIKLDERVREEIQDDVNALTRSQKYFQLKVDRADQYLPIIERILREENVPDDFKYLCIQESALIPDAISSSDAVGFWQFKKPAGQEVGLRIDSWVDERMNVVSSTRGASTYLKRHNAEFDNWIYALVSYNTGLTGAQEHVKERYFGSRKMELDKNTHWYVKKFLAHKFAYEYGVGKNRNPAVTLVEYTRGANKDLKDIAQETSTNYKDLSDYNLWLRKSKVPDDREYVVILPVQNGRSKEIAAHNPQARPEVVKDDRTGKLYPIISRAIASDEPYLVQINGLNGLIASEGDQFDDLTIRGNISSSKFMKYNDLSAPYSIKAGQVYYVEAKRARGKLYFHTASSGETMWSISQKFGVKEKKLRSLNRMGKSESVKPGRVLWLRQKRPKDKAIEYRMDLVSPGNTEPSKTQEVVVVQPSLDLGAEQSSTATFTPSGFKEHLNPDAALPVHVVEQGQTLYSIARMFGISVSQLAALNNISSEEVISIGQKIIVPPVPKDGLNDEVRVLFHEVIAGDNLYQIAKKYDISIEDLMEWNEMTDHHIQIGDKLVVTNPSK